MFRCEEESCGVVRVERSEGFLPPDKICWLGLVPLDTCEYRSREETRFELRTSSYKSVPEFYTGKIKMQCEEIWSRCIMQYASMEHNVGIYVVYM